MNAYLGVIFQPFYGYVVSYQVHTSPLTAPLFPLERGRTSTRYAASCWRREKVLSITSRSSMWYLRRSEAEDWVSEVKIVPSSKDHSRSTFLHKELSARLRRPTSVAVKPSHSKVDIPSNTTRK